MSLGEKRAFIIDTNVIYNIVHSSSNHEIQAFLNTYNDWQNGAYDGVMYFAQEVQNELEVQLLSTKINKKLRPRFRMEMSKFRTLQCSSTKKREHAVRQLAAYVAYTYKIPITGKYEDKNRETMMQYPSVSDARIILTAIDYEYDIVTSNIKDFLVLSCINPLLHIIRPKDNYPIVFSQQFYEELESDEFVEHLREQIINDDSTT
ncbi:DUF4411 family protein [Aneurinibacillus danicus]|uniref:PIN domain-containing protein n=1 Tax=Aneurinibacillus danicus TaxID=267746 RepID=A0A511VEE8_9BACL|nr:DUF4411 family protein [Aneurinibacillus danicus]GEN35943.1 hypothetical protein ADA01nite_34030 [Aneurinibacillus danicus]